MSKKGGCADHTSAYGSTDDLAIHRDGSTAGGRESDPQMYHTSSEMVQGWGGGG